VLSMRVSSAFPLPCFISSPIACFSAFFIIFLCLSHHTLRRYPLLPSVIFLVFPCISLYACITLSAGVRRLGFMMVQHILLSHDGHGRLSIPETKAPRSIWIMGARMIGHASRSS
jgi:hypothetical protein